MARKRRRRGRRGGFKLPIISLAILGGQIGLAHAQSGGDIKGTLSGFAAMYTGFNFVNQAFEPTRLIQGYAPWLAKRFLLPLARPRLGGMHLPVSLS